MNTQVTSSIADQIARLEMVGAVNAQEQLESENAELREALAQKEHDHVDEISGLKRSGLDPIESAIGILRGHAEMLAQVGFLEAEVKDIAAQLANADSVNTVLDEKVAQLVAAAEVAAGQRDTAFKDLNRLSRDLDIQKGAVRTRDAELKELRAFNPKKQQKQIKNITQRNRELSEMNDRNGGLIKEYRGEIKILKDQLERVKQDNGRLVVALDDACEMIDENEASKSLWDDDLWSVVGHDQAPKRIYVQYKPTGEMRVYDLEFGGFLRATPVPAYVTDQARGRLERYTEVEGQLNEYKESGDANA